MRYLDSLSFLANFLIFSVNYRYFSRFLFLYYVNFQDSWTTISINFHNLYFLQVLVAFLRFSKLFLAFLLNFLNFAKLGFSWISAPFLNSLDFPSILFVSNSFDWSSAFSQLSLLPCAHYSIRALFSHLFWVFPDFRHFFSDFGHRFLTFLPPLSSLWLYVSLLAASATLFYARVTCRYSPRSLVCRPLRLVL